ncbi:LemA family protein [Methylobacterium sp. PvR107]|uniref:LemA family protein n=1 Tax=Methylobacterium sp. PvR107 TaxID=2806597 RepID=UPI0039185926
MGDIDAQLKQRHDLVPNLVETVRSDAAHERATLEAVGQARRAPMLAGDPGRVVQREAVLQARLGRLGALPRPFHSGDRAACSAGRRGPPAAHTRSRAPRSCRRDRANARFRSCSRRTVQRSPLSHTRRGSTRIECRRLSP